MIKYMKRDDADVEFFTDFSGENKREDITEVMWKYDVDFIDPALCDSFTNEVLSLNKPRKLGLGLHQPEGGNMDYRNSDVSFLSEVDMENKIIAEFRDTVVNKVDELNRKIFNFDLSHLMRSQFTEYDGSRSQHFNWHPDGPLGVIAAPHIDMSRNFVFRKLTAVICLTDYTEYGDGEFLLIDPMSSPDRSICSFKMTKGEAIIFPAFITHKVQPVTSGKRISLVNWFCGPRWR